MYDRPGTDKPRPLGSGLSVPGIFVSWLCLQNVIEID